MIVTNIETIPGMTVAKHYGIVSGNTVRAKHFGHDMLAGLKSTMGGELNSYTELLEEARQEATDRMIQKAQNLGANAIVNVRYATCSLAKGTAEIYVYGTAVLAR